MNYKHSCVVDADFIYKAFVLVLFEQKTGGVQEEIVQDYILQEGDQLIDVSPPPIRQHAGIKGFISPRWDIKTQVWVEDVSAEEIFAWEEKHPDPNAKTLEQLKEEKEQEISSACNQAIVSGMDVQTSEGTEHFSLENTDQINLTTALSAVENGATLYPYHADGKMCRMFTSDEIRSIAQSSIRHKLYHTTLCNHLLVWTRRANSQEELSQITYDADNLPSDLASNMGEIFEASLVKEV